MRESVSVDGRTIATPAWEAEVTARSAGYVAAADAAMFLLLGLVVASRIHKGASAEAAAVSLVVGAALAFACQQFFFPRFAGARTALCVAGAIVFLLSAYVAGAGVERLSSPGRRGIDETMLVTLLGISSALANFYLVVGLSSPRVRAALQTVRWRLAPLASVAVARGSLVGWVAVAMALLAFTALGIEGILFLTA